MCSVPALSLVTSAGTVQQGSQDAMAAVKQSIENSLKNLKPQEIVTSIIEKLTDLDAWVDLLPEPRKQATADAVLAAVDSQQPSTPGPGGQEKTSLGRNKLTVTYVVVILFELTEQHPDAVNILCVIVLLWSLLAVCAIAML
jgi:hypothetical protein